MSVKPKPEKEKPKKIEIEGREDVQKLIKEAKAEIPTTEIPLKPKRGRPEKVRPDATLDKYKKFPLCIEINKVISFALNTTITKPDLMKPEDTNIGEALMYTFEYYGWRSFDHPTVILVFAILGTVWTVWQKRVEAKKALLPEPVKVGEKPKKEDLES